MLWITAAFGACFVAIELGLRDAPVLWFAALRAIAAGVALLAVAGVQHRPAPSGVRAWGLITVLGLVNVTVGFAAMFGGVAGLATGTAAVLANAQPLLILLPAWWLYGEAVSGRTAGALVVGFTGLVVVAVPGGGGSGAALVVAGCGGHHRRHAPGPAPGRARRDRGHRMALRDRWRSPGNGGRGRGGGAGDRMDPPLRRRRWPSCPSWGPR